MDGVGWRCCLEPQLAACKEGIFMLSWAIGFFILAVIAAVLGFGGIAGSAAMIAKVLFVVFLILFVVSLLRGRKA